MHAATHLASYSRIYGTLHGFSSFPFENHLKSIKNRIRKPNHPLPQVIRRLIEKVSVIMLKNVKTTHCNKEHFQGPVSDNIVECVQFKEIHLPEYVLSTCVPDNAIQVGNTTCVILNIIIYNHKRKHVCQAFRHKKDFFTYPVQSRRLNNWSVSHINEQLLLYDLTDRTAKVVLLSYKNNFISFPLLQS